MAKQYRANLTYGTSYIVKGFIFEQGKPKIIDESLKNYLEETATYTDYMERNNKTLTFCRFDFTELGKNSKPEVEETQEETENDEETETNEEDKTTTKKTSTKKSSRKKSSV